MDSSSSSSSPMDVFEPSSSRSFPPKDFFCTFLENYPTPLYSSSSDDLNVFWSHDERKPIQDKMRCAFENLGVDVLFTFLIQFWAPVSVCGRRLLTTSGQPFALFRREGASDRDDQEHRLCSVKYKYNVDHVNKVQVEAEEDPTIITDGPPASAFLNRIPELLFVRLILKKNPLLSSASKCGLPCSFVVPVFDPSQSGDCVGVVECFTFFTPDLLHAFNKLNMALEDQGLKAFDAHDYLRYKTICGLQNAKDELDKALKIISQAHGLPLSQVWIPCEDENLVACSSSLQDTRTEQILWLKLTRHIGHAFLDGADLESLEDYDTAYYRLPMKMDGMFPRKTLENYEPLFIQKSNDDHQHQLFSPCDYFLLICLRSTKTGDLNYVFEFLWNHEQGVILLEPLLLTLERYLPSFKFASGKELGDEIDILDVDNSKGSENKYIKIFQRNKISLKRGTQSKVEECLIPSKASGKTTPIKLSREQNKSQFGQTMEEVAPKLNVSVSTLKRKCKDEGIKWEGEDRSKRIVKHSYNNQNYMNEEEDQGGASQDPSTAIIRETLDENILTIKAEYADDVIKFTLPISSATYEAIQKEIVKKFELDHTAQYKLKYLDDEDNEWILFKYDEDVRLCTKNKRNIRLCLLQRDPSTTYKLT